MTSTRNWGWTNRFSKLPETAPNKSGFARINCEKSYLPDFLLSRIFFGSDRMDEVLIRIAIRATARTSFVLFLRLFSLAPYITPILPVQFFPANPPMRSPS
jgi:hypothetical protein